ncbi:hypothetical protein CH253_22685 [Rhodococcus sp. 06-156-3C]|nr:MULTISPECIES: hypothetical protein [unclassified Rhodococcus (in: high G+C Gram-positive bacteria)]OZD15777.1 hypothetical protein CH253_22685 [Rhodococcus sp. 06-156-3C]OZD21161.1 hypothetical protein CH280_02915 [Rhodococcus sp. 06-156-4C]OZD32343.1 hypothetical protein CH284_20845 [Rhodococcus sp. 06-156-3]OZD36565.1 hypothetical protein CH247_03270 [Rhodococcus sp. 06-156-3b]OZF59285.1 hypothetical protein CH290_21740 [Rhodococcus sp. 06-156-4]
MVAAVVIVVLVVAVAVTALSVRGTREDNSDALDFSGFPRILTCVSVSDTVSSPNAVDIEAPDPVLARTVQMQHLGADRLEITIAFAGPPPPVPQQVPMSGYSSNQLFSEPGSLDFGVVLFPGGLGRESSDNYNLAFERIDSYAPGGAASGQWSVHGDSEFLDDTPAESVTTEVDSAQILEDSVRFTVDLADFPPLAKAWTSTPDLIVYPQEYGYPSAAGGGLRQYQRQHCTDTASTRVDDDLTAPPRTPSAETTTGSADGSNSAAENSSMPPLPGENSASENNSNDLVGEPVPPGACANGGGVCQLSSPSGDYYCTITQTGAFCSSPVGEPLSAGIDARLITVGSDGETGLITDSGGNSHLQDRQSMQATTLPYGNTMTAYGMTCGFTGATGGATCLHEASGHGFQISTSNYRFF